MRWDGSVKSYNPVFDVLIRMWPYWQYLIVAIKQERFPDWQQPCCDEAPVCRWLATEKREMECSHFNVFFFFFLNHCSEGNICASNKDSGPVSSASISMLCLAAHMNDRTCVAAPLQLSAVTWAPSFTSHHSWEQRREKYEEARVEPHMSDKVVRIHLNSCSRLYSWFNLQNEVWWYYSLALSVD